MSTLPTQTNIESSLKSFKKQPEDFEFVEPDISDVITEDDTHVDNLITEKQQRLLTTTLYSSFQTDLPFLATANVGLFYGNKIPPLVPDVLLSLRVKVPEDWSQKQNRSYFVFYFGKPPEIAIEIVSNKIGNELGSKLQDYAFAAVGYYVVFDPLKQLGETILRVYELRGNSYVELGNFYLSQVGLGLTIWHGIFKGKEYDWLRWCDDSGNILLTGDERAEQEKQRDEQEKQRAEQEKQGAEQEKQRAEQEKQRADRLTELLRERGINPDELL
ncbi:MAG: Uma2 family endonuclease [Okeania sp. SIO3H1]|uniref:Uma2 family endonuclease n=1 Tax=Okeania sp. SIO1I7 TaxID=2607772 RepID=UPI0013CB53BD|nr:Uma2 family endonuclease [Okeania sp. SIO1I7]NEN93908.1 Uma2 family endonuclease [Okeania sp. SIO3H1]NET28891.1 Uma2 family endonuclease [Okeania sp. SIO1I7]